MLNDSLKIGDVFGWVKGKKPKILSEEVSDKLIPYLSAAYFRNGEIKFYADPRDKNCVLVNKNDVVLIWDGSNAGDVFRGLGGALSSTMVKFKESNKCTNDFLFYLLKYHFKNLNQHATGSTIPHVNGAILKNIEIPYLEINQQQSIVHVLSTVQKAIAAQEALIAKLKELKRSMMQYLFTHGTKGEKTKMTEIGEIPESWDVEKLGHVLLKSQYGLSKKGNGCNGHPILRMTNQKNGYISLDRLQYVELTDSELEKFEIYKNDIIFNRTNSLELVARTARNSINF